MKKLARTITFLSLLSISLASYFFLELQNYRTNQAQQLSEPAVEQQDQQQAPVLPAPDVILVKKVIETARRFVPAGTLSY